VNGRRRQVSKRPLRWRDQGHLIAMHVFKRAGGVGMAVAAVGGQMSFTFVCLFHVLDQVGHLL